MSHQLVRRAAGPRSNHTLAAAIAVALGVAPQIYAADAPDTLEEVVVTANRREQNVLDVPYNISALSGLALQTSGVASLTDIARLLPGINVPDLGPRASSSNSNIVIRGLNANDPGSSAYLPWESVPLVSTYVDEVPMFVNMNLSDVQRVEVLRGPQGTLYGSGAVAGTIRVIHNQPDPSKFSADLSLDASNTSRASDASYGVSGLVNIPLGDTAALRANAGYTSTAGFIDASNAVVFGPNAQPVLANPASPLTSNFVTQPLKDVDSAHSSYARAALLWHVTPVFDATLAYQRQDDHSNAFSRQTQGQSYVDQSFIPIAPDHRVIDLEALTLSFDAGFATVTSSTSFTKNRDQSTYDESPFLLAYDAASPLYYGNYPRPTTEFITESKDSSLVEELRLVSKAGGPIDYTVGGFFRHQYNDLFQYETIPGFSAWSQLPGSANAINQYLLGTTGIDPNYATFGDFVTQYNGGTPPATLRPLDTNYTYSRHSDFKDRALYGELTWHATSQWQITGGVRVFWQDVSEDLDQTIPYGGPYFSTLPVPDALGSTRISNDQTFHNHLFRLNTGYEITPTLRAYGTFSEGFRHGGTNAIAVGNCAFCDAASGLNFKPDTVKNYEIGLKGTVNNWLRFSGAVYKMRWDDIQIQLFDATASAFVANGGKAISQGVEMEFEALMGNGWSTTLGLGYSDSKVDSAFTINDTAAGKPVTLLIANAGDRLPYVPKQSLTAGLNYDHPVSSAVTLTTHVDASYRSDVTTQINSSATGYRQLGGFTTLNASAALQFSGQWRARLYGNNLTNQQGVSAAGPALKTADVSQYRFEYLMRPRTVGIALEYSFQ